MEEHEESGKEGETPKIYDQYKHKKDLITKRTLLSRGVTLIVSVLPSMAVV